MEIKDDRTYADIEIDRPTGPRVTIREPQSLGELVSIRSRDVSKSIISAAVTIGAAGIAFVNGRYKFASEH